MTKILPDIDNNKFRTMLIELFKMQDSGKTNTPEYNVLYNKVGKQVILLTDKLLMSASFRGYPQDLREDMKGEALLCVMENLRKYDHEKFDNPFAYYTSAVFNVFRQMLNKNNLSLERNVRFNILEEFGMETLVAENKFKEKISYGKVSTKERK